jgi:hypothetical protein
MRGARALTIACAALLSACHAATPAWVPQSGRRLVVTPTEVGVLEQAGPLTRVAVVLVRFPLAWDAPVASAFLVLEPKRSAERGPQTVAIRVARVLEPWHAVDVAAGRLPRLAPAEISAVASGVAERPTRIDITKVVRSSIAGHADAQAIALIVAAPLPFALGADTGLGPRVDVYLR